jgi:hypothetical protein
MNIKEVNSEASYLRKVASQLPVGHSHGKFVLEEELEVGL